MSGNHSPVIADEKQVTAEKKQAAADEKRGTEALKPLSRISVRTLVEFLLRSGDIDRRDGQGTIDPEAALLGAKLHRKIQKAQKSPEYASEVPLSIDTEYEDLVVRVEGRADGVIHHRADGRTDRESDGKPDKSTGGKPDRAPDGKPDRNPGRKPDEQPDMDSGRKPDETQGDETAERTEVTVEEIKGMYLDVRLLEEPFPVHLAQAKCYAHILAEEEHLSRVRIRMTYANLESEDTKFFISDWTREELSSFFKDLTDRWHVWASWQMKHISARNESMKDLQFPFPWREGQKRLTAAVYHTIREKQQLFLMAPTGVGKTMSCVYPAVRALGEDLADRIFYLTGKNETLAAGREAFSILEQNGLDFRTIQITSKEKICPYDEPRCNPDDCRYAKGHFDRVNDAVFELLRSGAFFDREAIRTQSEARQVCPFELTLDTSVWCDAVLCDYNYVFDPNAKLARFFGNGNRGRNIFLIDEAHNLVDRGREMYSASLVKEHVLSAKKLLRKGGKRDVLSETGGGETGGGDIEEKAEESKTGTLVKDRKETAAGRENRRVIRALDRINRQMLELRHRTEEHPTGSVLGRPYLLLSIEEADPFIRSSMALGGAMQEFYRESGDAQTREELLDFYFEILEVMNTCDALDGNYVIYASEREGAERGKTEFALTFFCINPAARITEEIGDASASVFFSATLLPLSFYRTLLTTRPEPYAVYARSSFSENMRKILIAEDVSTLYKFRGEEMYRKIARYIRKTAEAKTGNYIAFFPSHSMLRDVFRVYRDEFDTPGVNWVLQNPHMRDEDREIFMENFYEDPETSLVGFCVMGGMFSEGIDLTGTRLIGALVVGAGLPQVSTERELIRGYFDGELPGEESGKEERGGRDPGGRREKRGFDYAYRYPGMNKVEQAAGRVIRTASDRGVILLLDDRLLKSDYRRIFPREWSDASVCSLDTVSDELRRFWDGEDAS